MDRRQQIIGAFSLLAARLIAPLLGLRSLSSARPALAQAAPRPSILVIQTDDMRVDDLQAMPKTRAFFGQGGMTFENYVVPTPWCCPSRASALTGLYPHNHTGTFCDHRIFKGLGYEGRTIAVALHGAGYHTAFVGKYLNGYPAGPRGQVPAGWRNWFAFAGGKTCGGTCNRTGGRYYDYRISVNGRTRVFGDKPEDYSTDVLTRRALTIIRQRPRGTPLFLWVNPYAPHGRLVPARRHLRRAVPGQGQTPAFNNIGTGKSPWMGKLPKLTRQVRGYIHRTSRDRRRTLLAVDAMVAKLAAAMPAGSYIFFCSDNGYMRGELRIPLGKHVPYKPSSEVPLLVRGPGIAAGSVTQAVASPIDLAPTWAALAGITLPWPADGISLVPFLTSGTPSSRDSVLVELIGSSVSAAELEGDVLPAGLLTPEAGADEEIGAARRRKGRRRTADPQAPRYVPPAYLALRGATWLYIEWSRGHREYYDHTVDPNELNNRYHTLSPERQLELAQRVQQLRSCHGLTCTA